MQSFDRPRLNNLPLASQSRLTHARLRRPTRLPTVMATTVWGRYLDRLRSLFGGL